MFAPQNDRFHAKFRAKHDVPSCIFCLSQNSKYLIQADWLAFSRKYTRVDLVLKKSIKCKKWPEIWKTRARFCTIAHNGKTSSIMQPVEKNFPKPKQRIFNSSCVLISKDKKKKIESSSENINSFIKQNLAQKTCLETWVKPVRCLTQIFCTGIRAQTRNNRKNKKNLSKNWTNLILVSFRSDSILNPIYQSDILPLRCKSPSQIPKFLTQKDWQTDERRNKF